MEWVLLGHILRVSWGKWVILEKIFKMSGTKVFCISAEHETGHSGVRGGSVR